MAQTEWVLKILIHSVIFLKTHFSLMNSVMWWETSVHVENLKNTNE